MDKNTHGKISIVLVGYFFAIILPFTSYASVDINLRYGSRGPEVVELQEFLIDQGFLKNTATGNFYSLTKSAVIAYQTSVGLPATGYAGPLTREKINKLLSSTIPEEEAGITSAPVINDEATRLRKQIEDLQAQLKQLNTNQQTTNSTLQQIAANTTPTPTTPSPTPTPVVPKPMVTKFEATKYSANLGDKVVISWQADNAITCAISERRDISIPFTGRLPSGDMEVTLEKTGNHTGAIFDYYAICADKDWNTDVKSFTITINEPRFTSDPAIISTYRSTPDQGEYWRAQVQMSFVNADAVGYKCSTDDPNDYLQNNRQPSFIEWWVPQNGFKWNKTYNCIFNLQKIEGSLQNGNLTDLNVTKNLSFSTPAQ